MTKTELVRSEMMKALKDRDTARKDALSILLSALKAKTIDKRSALSEEEENEVVGKEIKQLKETIATTPADRAPVITECENRIKIYSEFIPEQLGEAEIRAIVSQVLAGLSLPTPTRRDMGLIMKHLMPLVKGKADGALVNKIVGEMLS